MKKGTRRKNTMVELRTWAQADHTRTQQRRETSSRRRRKSEATKRRRLQGSDSARGSDECEKEETANCSTRTPRKLNAPPMESSQEPPTTNQTLLGPSVGHQLELRRSHAAKSCETSNSNISKPLLARSDLQVRVR